MKLTIGMAVYDDYDGAFFTIQSLRMHHSSVMHRVEFVVIDNNPDSPAGKALKRFCSNIRQPIQYIPCTSRTSTAIRSMIFDAARTEYVMSIDCHVLLASGAIEQLLRYYDLELDNGNLLQGPLLYDDLQQISTHFDLVWRDNMWGTWGTDPRGLDITGAPFEIPAQGLGLFTCRKSSWPGFNEKFRGFGGEEGYIHEKFKAIGKTTMCLPFLRWNHRFDRPNGVPYSVTLEDRLHNYLVGFIELGRDTAPVLEHFQKSIPAANIEAVKKQLQIQ